MDKNVLQIFNGADVEGITALITKMEQSPFDYLELEGDGLRIVIGKNKTLVLTGAPSSATAARAQMDTPVDGTKTNTRRIEGTGAATAKIADTTVAADETGTTKASVMDEQPGVIVIKSPSFGLFYAQPEPGATPYVSVGNQVKIGDTIGLVEIMKTFTAVTSTVNGEVVAIHAKNEQLLEPDMPLVSINVS